MQQTRPQGGPTNALWPPFLLQFAIDGYDLSHRKSGKLLSGLSPSVQNSPVASTSTRATYCVFLSVHFLVFGNLF